MGSELGVLLRFADTAYKSREAGDIMRFLCGISLPLL